MKWGVMRTILCGALMCMAIGLSQLIFAANIIVITRNQAKKCEKQNSMGYGATQCFEMGGHEDNTLWGTMCISIGLLQVIFATNIIIITRN